MSIKIHTPMALPDLDRNGPIAALYIENGALHELQFDEVKKEAKIVITKILYKPTQVSVDYDDPVQTIVRTEVPDSQINSYVAYNPETDLVYMVLSFRTPSWTLVRSKLIAVDPRSKTVVNSKDLHVRTPLNDINGPYAWSDISSQFGEIHIYAGANFEVYDATTLDLLYTYSSSGEFKPLNMLTANLYWRYNGGANTLTTYTKSVTTGVATFTPVATSASLVGTVNVPSLVYNHVSDEIWGFFSVSTNSTPGDIAFRWDHLGNNLSFIAKQGAQLTPPTSSGNYTFYKSHVRSNGDVIATCKPNSSNYHGAYQYSSNGTLLGSYALFVRNYNSSPWAPNLGIPYMIGDRLVVTDFWDSTSLMAYDIGTYSIMPTVRFDAAVSRITESGWDSYMGMRQLLDWGGSFVAGVINIPANARIVSAPTYNRAEPTPLDVLPTPAIGSGIITADYTSALNEMSGIIWHKIEFDASRSLRFSFLPPDDDTARAAQNKNIERILYMVLYSSTGRVLYRGNKGDSSWPENNTPYTSYHRRPKLNPVVLAKHMPAGNYYLAIINGGDQAYNGRVMASDVEFDYTTADQTAGGHKYRLRIEAYAK